MKMLLVTALALATSSAFACKLKSPIDLRDLKFEDGKEQFSQAETHPLLKLIAPGTTKDLPFHSVLTLTYVRDAGIIDGVALGARVELPDFSDGVGLADVYAESLVERSVEKTADGEEIHTIKTEPRFQEWNLFIPVQDDMSVVKIKDNKVTSIHITHTNGVVDVTKNSLKLDTKSICVLEASR